MMLFCEPEKASFIDQLRQQEEKNALVSPETEDRWNLNADHEKLRHALGLAFAGTESVGGEPLMDWALEHCSLSQEERVQLTRFVMSYPFYEDLSNPSFRLGLEANDGKIISLASIGECNTDKESPFQIIRNYWIEFATTAKLLIFHKEKVPDFFQSKDHKADLERFSKKVEKFLKNVRRWHHEYGPKGQHWYVHLVGVIPEFHGQGRGKQVMTKLNDMADKMDRPMYLEAGERNRTFYEKFGFKVKHTETFVDPDNETNRYQLHLMTREPRSSRVDE